MTDFNPTITQHGWEALTRAHSKGDAIVIEHLALGDKTSMDLEQCIALQHEQQRVAILQSVSLTPQQLQLTTRVQGDVEYWVYEWGLYLSDGTLFAIWSSTTPLAYKAKNIDLVLTINLVLNQLPTESIVIVETSQSLFNTSTCHLESTAVFSRVLIDLMRRQIVINSGKKL